MFKKIWNFLNKDPISGKSGSFKLRSSFPELQIQREVQNYNKFGVMRSITGVVVFLIILYLIINLVNYFQNEYNGLKLILDLAIYIPLAILLFRGKRRAITITMIAWTIDRIYVLGTTGKISQIILWLIVMVLLFKALEVEKRRNREIKGYQLNNNIGK